MKIQKFILHYKASNLGVVCLESSNEQTEYQLPFEYLRVFSPAQVPGKSPLVTHKKHVKIQVIESVGKHGSRFTFDDQHSAIYSNEHLQDLAINQTAYWQEYLAQLKDSGHSREAMIDIKQV